MKRPLRDPLTYLHEREKIAFNIPTVKCVNIIPVSSNHADEILKNLTSKMLRDSQYPRWISCLSIIVREQFWFWILFCNKRQVIECRQQFHEPYSIVFLCICSANGQTYFRLFCISTHERNINAYSNFRSLQINIKQPLQYDFVYKILLFLLQSYVNPNLFAVLYEHFMLVF